jgi:hypothetical protein
MALTIPLNRGYGGARPEVVESGSTQKYAGRRLKNRERAGRDAGEKVSDNARV